MSTTDKNTAIAAISPSSNPNSNSDNTVDDTVKPDSTNGYNIIRLGFITAAGVGIAAMGLSAADRTMSESVILMANSVIVGIFAFLAGRKT